MPQHHLDSLTHSLTQKGWKIVSTCTPNDYPYGRHVWQIERGSVCLEIQFDSLGFYGEDLPLLQAYGCSIKDHESVSLYFSKEPKWQTELLAFIRALDRIID